MTPYQHLDELLDACYDDLEWPIGYNSDLNTHLNFIVTRLKSFYGIDDVDKLPWNELDHNEYFVEFISSVYINLPDSLVQNLAIFCLDFGLVNCQLTFAKEIYSQYQLSEVSTYLKIVGD